ncbi:MAG: regulatory protein RecX [Clostridia bacterium]
MNITAIEGQKNNNEKVNLFVDGEYYCSLSVDVVFKSHLKIGEIDSAEFEKIVEDNERIKAFTSLLNTISRGAYCKAELHKKLVTKGFSVDVAQNAIDKAIGYGYIDDSEYAKRFVAEKSKTHGANYVKQQLKFKGVCQADIDVAFEGEVPDCCLEVAQKKAKNLNLAEQKDVQKLVSHLNYRGFGWDSIAKALKALRDDID